jgi:DNA polymerase I-like protein with 3'-5' exonuclease and polymerase domains
MLTVDSKNFDWKNIPLGDCLEGNAKDANLTLKIFHVLESKLDPALINFYKYVITPITSIFTDLEYRGILIDPNSLEAIGTRMKKHMEKLELDLLESSPIENPNFASNEDLIKILFSLKKVGKSWEVDNVGFGVFPPALTEKGQPSVDADTLSDLKNLIDKEVVKRGIHVQE